MCQMSGLVTRLLGPHFLLRLSVSILDLTGLVQGNNTPRSSGFVLASSGQNNEPVVLSSDVRRSPGRLVGQLWWDPGTRAQTHTGETFWRGGVRFLSLEGVVGTLDLLAHPSYQSFLTPAKGQGDRTAICNADHVQDRRKKPGINGSVSICWLLMSSTFWFLTPSLPSPRQTAIAPLSSRAPAFSLHSMARPKTPH